MATRHIALIILLAATLSAQQPADRKDWIQLFNGKDLTGWTPKITGYAVGENFGNTWRVENGVLKVSYDKYDNFTGPAGPRFGHMFYKDKFSYYILRGEYRFVGPQCPGGPAWATKNSGFMVHGQPADTMQKDQDFPISIEVQLLGGLGKGPRATANLCTPGTNVEREGKLFTTHCVNSSSPTFEGEEWVNVEVEVLGNEKITHKINGVAVLSYEKPQIGGGSVSKHDPAVKQDGKMLEEGSISVQSESHPIEFRKIELLNLSGCMDPKASNFKSYYVHKDNAQCTYGKKK